MAAGVEPLPARGSAGGRFQKGVTRRRLLGAGAAGVLSGAVLAACSTTGASGRTARAGAGPSSAHAGITLLFAPGYGAVTYNSTLVSLFQEAIQPFLAATPGVRVDFTASCCNGTTLATQNLAGAAPDVSAQFETQVILPAHAALDIAPYVQRDNVDTSVFGAGRLSVWQSNTGALYGLPMDTNAYGMVLNLTELNALGLSVPAKNWTSGDAQRLFERATHTNSQGKRVSGGSVMCYRDQVYMPDSLYLHGYGATYADPANPAQCTLHTPAAIAAGHWVFDPLVNGVCQNVHSCFPFNMYYGTAVIDVFGLCSMLMTAQQLRGFDWDFWPMPTFPQGRFTHAGSDAYVIASGTKHPEQAWELVKWLATQPDWQRFQMNAMLLAPVVQNLWDQYDTVVSAVAPPLATKDLTVLRDMGTFVLDSNFAYAPNEAVTIMGTYANQILAGKLSVDAAFPRIAAQINALEQAAAAGGQTSA